MYLSGLCVCDTNLDIILGIVPKATCCFQGPVLVF